MTNTVLLGDCLELMPSIPDKSIDMILCDLPYGTTACKWDVIIPFEPLWVQYKRIIKDNGAIVLTASQPFTTRLISSNYDMFRYEWIWEKEQGTGFFNAKKQPLKEHENILIFSKISPEYNPIMKGSQIRKVTRGTDVSENYGSKSKYLPPVSEYVGFYPTTIIKISTQRGLHPTQKPVALFEYLIKTYTNEGDLVLDNCAGSGTTAIACLNTNRNYILMEKERKYFDIINRRIAEHQGLFKVA